MAREPADVRFGLKRLARWGCAVALASASVFGCTPELGYDQRGGPSIADHIRTLQSPLVSRVDYQPGDAGRSATISVVLKPDVDVTAAQGLVCGIALPFAEAADPPAGLSIIAVRDDSQVVVSDDACR
jgi:hypothetical protein